MCDCEDQETCGCEGVQLPTINGQNGLSNYELWLQAGNVGTLPVYLASLQGADGADGADAYDVAVENGFVGDEAAWLASLVGAPGTNGTNGTNGSSPFTDLRQSFIMPAVGLTVPIEGTDWSWAPNGTWISIETADVTGTLRGWFRVIGGPSGPNNTTINIRNPGASDGYPSGIPTNRGVGGIIETNSAVNQVAVSGPPGPPGVNGTNGTNGSNGAAGTTGGQGIPGTEILFLNVDPNTLPGTFGRDGDIVWQVDVPNQVTVWQRSAPAVWAIQQTLAGTVPVLSAQVFRVGKTLNQPIPTGSTANLVVGFENSVSAGFYNGGWWNGSAYNAQAGITTPMTFTLENMSIFRNAGAGENITFDVFIRVDGVTQATGSIVLTVPDTEGVLPVITTGPVAVTAASEVFVWIKPATGSTEQWYVDFGDIVFYNQTV